MPGLTGIELAKETLALRSDFPIILCTGFSNEVNPKRVAAIGIRRFMMKPFLPHELGAAIREILDRKQEAPPSDAEEVSASAMRPSQRQ
jgi:DNA-binding NarL/FixJ family response regulator